MVPISPAPPPPLTRHRLFPALFCSSTEVPPLPPCALCDSQSSRREAESIDFSPSPLTQHRDLVPYAYSSAAIGERETSQDSSPLSRATAPSASPYISREDIHEGGSAPHRRQQSQSSGSQQPLDSNTLDRLNGLAERTPLSAVRLLASSPLSVPHRCRPSSGGLSVAPLGGRLWLQSSR
jgi:hypothetical protein